MHRRILTLKARYLSNSRIFYGQARHKTTGNPLSDTARKVAEEAEKGWKKIRDSFSSNPMKSNPQTQNVYNSVKETVTDAKRSLLDESASRYGGIASRISRDKIKKMRMDAWAVKHGGSASSSQGQSVESNPEAGASVVLHKDAKWKEAWNQFKEKNPISQGLYNMRRKYEESDNPFVNTARFWADRIQSALESSNILSESDEAIVLAELKHRDPTFTIEAFSKELREYIVPEVVESFVYWNEKEFGKWASEAVMSKTLAHREAVMEGNLTLESKLLDIRGIEVKGEMVDETPVLIVYFNTQQTEVVRNKIGDIVGGSPDIIQSVMYVMALAKEEESQTTDPITNGWKVVDFMLGGARETL